MNSKSKKEKGLRTPSAHAEYLKLHFSSKASDYKLLAPIGNDAHDHLCLYAACYTPLNVQVCIRVHPLLCLSLSEIDAIRKEIEVAKQFAVSGLQSPLANFVRSTELWTVYPIMRAGSLTRVLQYLYTTSSGRSRNLLDEKSIAYIMLRVLNVLRLVHAQGCIYNALQADHVLLCSSGLVTLSNMKHVVEMHLGGHASAYGACIKRIPWLAPEYLAQTGSGYTEKVDIYAFGITLLEMIYTFAPYLTLPASKSMLLKLYGLVGLTDKDPCLSGFSEHGSCNTASSKNNAPLPSAYISKQLKEVIDACLQSDPQIRPSAAKLAEFAFFKRADAFPASLESLLKGIPDLSEFLNRRYLINEQELVIKKHLDFDDLASIYNEYHKEPHEETFVFLSELRKTIQIATPAPKWDL